MNSTNNSGAQCKVSIIIPCYNAERYIAKCVDSLLTQTHKNLEIILVNDGSTDNTLELCNSFAKQDERISVIDKTNGGASDSRNRGLDKCTGDYICFVDSDDFVAPDHVESLLSLAIKNDSDIAASPFRTIQEDEQADVFGDKSTPDSTYKECAVAPLEAVRIMFYQKEFDSTLPCKLYKRHIFDNLRFQVGIIFEDLHILPDVLLSANRVAYTDKQTYAYVLRTDSVEGSQFSEKKLTSMNAVFDKLTSDKRLDAIDDARTCRLFSIASRMFFSMPADHPEKKKIWQFMTGNRMRIIRDGNARLKNRIAAMLTFLGPNICSKVYSLIKTR